MSVFRCSDLGTVLGTAKSRVGACLLMLFFPFLTFPANAQVTLDKSTLARLQTGAAVVDVRPDPEGASGLVQAVIDIPAPPKRVWEVMLDCAHSKRAIAALISCRVLEQGADGRFDVREHVVQWLWPLPSVRSVFRSDYKPYEHIAFKRIEGDLALLEGEWCLVPFNDGRATRLFYRARMTPGWVVPDAIARAAIESDVPKTLAALRQEALRRE